MRVLILGDIHGNLVALEELLIIEKNNYDLLVCHGDVVNYGPWSNECVQLLDSLKNKILLKGNHEDNYLKRSYAGTNVIAQTFFDFCFPTFNEFDKIEAYNKSCSIGDFIVQHTINDQYVYPDTDMEDFDIRNNYVIGHSHYAFDKKIKTRRVINTGSLGQNRVFINQSDYVIYDLDKNTIELKCFTNSFNKLISEMKSKGYPDLCMEYYLKKKQK
jgi:predicted phosphodiesterase